MKRVGNKAAEVLEMVLVVIETARSQGDGPLVETSTTKRTSNRSRSPDQAPVPTSRNHLPHSSPVARSSKRGVPRRRASCKPSKVIKRFSAQSLLGRRPLRGVPRQTASRKLRPKAGRTGRSTMHMPTMPKTTLRRGRRRPRGQRLLARSPPRSSRRSVVRTRRELTTARSRLKRIAAESHR